MKKNLKPRLDRMAFFLYVTGGWMRIATGQTHDDDDWAIMSGLRSFSDIP